MFALRESFLCLLICAIAVKSYPVNRVKRCDPNALLSAVNMGMQMLNQGTNLMTAGNYQQSSSSRTNGAKSTSTSSSSSKKTSSGKKTGSSQAGTGWLEK